ncbi:MAG TPA: tyrosine recombinase XerC [Chitinophagales bacterium]|nr:tyrosine recombinase XerC [Chitinophagales bacterium]
MEKFFTSHSPLRIFVREAIGMMDFRSFLQYLEYEKRYSAHTITAYENDLTQFSVFLSKIYEFDDLLNVRHTHVRSWLVSLMEEGIGSRSINRKLSSLKTFFKFQLKKNAIQQNPMSKVIAPKMSKRLPVFINKNQMELLWQHFDFGEGFSGARNRLIFELLYGTGMRVSELVNLSEKNIDLHSGAVKVLGKGNKERIIPISRELKQFIKEYNDLRHKTFPSGLFSSLIVSDTGNKMYARSVYNIVNTVLKQITTVEKKSPHVLRHTFATHMLNNGAEINAIKELLGHASLAATQVYTHNTIEKLKDVYRKAHPKA